jgi:hypothetical protein
MTESINYLQDVNGDFISSRPELGITDVWNSGIDNTKISIMKGVESPSLNIIYIIYENLEEHSNVRTVDMTVTNNYGVYISPLGEKTFMRFHKPGLFVVEGENDLIVGQAGNSEAILRCNNQNDIAMLDYMNSWRWRLERDLKGIGKKDDVDKFLIPILKRQSI